MYDTVWLATMALQWAVAQAFKDHNISISTFILSILKDNQYHQFPCTLDLVKHMKDILTAFPQNEESSESTSSWADKLISKNYSDSIKALTMKENGWYVGALHASAKQLEHFQIENMAKDMKRLAPNLWSFLGELLSLEWEYREQADSDGNHFMDGTEGSDELRYWDAEDTWAKDGELDENGVFVKHRPDLWKKKAQQVAVFTIVRVI
jgi:hypothetical protein